MVGERFSLFSMSTSGHTYVHLGGCFALIFEVLELRVEAQGRM